MVSKYYFNSIQTPLACRFIVFAGFLLCALSCLQTKQEQRTGKSESVTVVRKPGSTYQDTLLISSPAAVFFTLDSTQLARYRSTAPAALVESTTHEYHYLIETTGKILRARWTTLPILEAKNNRYLCFIKQDNSRFWVDLDKNNEIAGLYVFDGGKDPMLLDMTNADTELERYFAK